MLTTVKSSELRPARLPQPKPGNPRSANLLYTLLPVLCCFPMLYLSYIISTTGGNALSNDYVAVVYMIDRLLSSTVTPVEFVQQAYVGSHWMPLSLLVHLFDATVFQWNARVELLVGVALAALRVCVLYLLLRQPADTLAAKAVLASVLLALTFSLSQASVFLFGQASIPINLTLLFFALALWCLRHHAPRMQGVLLMSVCGVAACASFAAVPQTWMGLLIALPLLGYRKPLHYLLWLAGALLSALPYWRALFMVQPGTHAELSAPNLLFLLNALGRPFANGIGFNCGRIHGAEVVAVFGLLSLAALAVIAAKRQLEAKAGGKEQSKTAAFQGSPRTNLRVAGAAALVTYGLTSALFLSCVRQYAMPWYTSFSMLFWIGLALLPGLTRNVAQSIFLGAIAVIYILTNRSYEDKQIYMYTRSPSSEAVLRNYASAPTYGEAQLFQWGDGNPMALRYLSEPLHRYRLSACAPEQEWSLQGDYILDSVKVTRGQGVSFILGNDRLKKSTWGDFKHLNLNVPQGAEVRWILDVPPDAQRAQFETAVFPTSTGISGCSARIVLKDGPMNQVVFDSRLAHATKHEVNRSLLEFKGRRIELVFSCADDSAVFRYPTVSIKLAQGKTPVASRRRAPSNTDLARAIPITVSDLVLPPLSSPHWRSSNISLALAERSKMLSASQQELLPSVACTMPDNVRLGDYSHLFVRMSALENLAPRSLKARIDYTTGSSAYISIPLLEESGMHGYTYDFKLMETAGDRVMKCLTLFPVARNSTNGIMLDEVRLLSAGRESTRR